MGRVVGQACAKRGRIDVIVNNAGYGLFGAAEEVSDEQVRLQIDTNLIGSIAVIRACWTDERVTHDGPRFHYDGLRVEPKPRQSPPDVWLGGIAPSELPLAGHLGHRGRQAIDRHRAAPARDYTGPRWPASVARARAARRRRS